MDSKHSFKVITHATVVNAHSISADTTVIIDLSNGRISWVGKDKDAIIPEGAEIVDASGCIVVPGGIDPHVHLQYPQGPELVVSADSFESGSKAALLGGTTTVIDFVEPTKVPAETMVHALEKRRKEAEGSSLVDFTFHMTIHTVPCTLEPVIEAGIHSFKLYTAYDIGLNNADMYQAAKSINAVGGSAIVHCEDNAVIMERIGYYITEYQKGNYEMGLSKQFPELRPDSNEVNATRNIIEIMEKAAADNGSINPVKLHIAHITIPEQIDLLKEGVTGEICPHHFTLDSSIFQKEEPQHYQCSPAVKGRETADKLKEILRNPDEPHTLFCVTDHCPFTKNQRDGKERRPGIPDPWWIEDPVKPMPFWVRPGGLPGIQERLELLYEAVVGDLDVLKISASDIENEKNATNKQLRRFVVLSSEAAAKRYNLKHKGVLAEGYDADITIIKPEPTPVQVRGGASVCDVRLYDDYTTHMSVRDVMVRGNQIVKNGELTELAKEPKGQFLRQDE